MRIKSFAVCAAMVVGALHLVPALSAMGRTPGKFDVTRTGAATYSIPIFTPPGPHGVQPSIALVYSSNADIGYLGKGWQIAGLSAISRCNKTFAQDGIAISIALATSDGYCLDGNRLRLTSGLPGAGGSTYQTEIADFSLVTAVGAAGYGPASFTVQKKDGLIYEYGGTTDSRVLATGTSTATTWMVSQISDRSGNKVKFTYKTPDAGTTGTTEPISIEWAATTFGGSTFFYKMVFSYGSNAAASSEAAYVAGTAVLNDDILSSISIQSNGSTRKKYFLAYQTSPTSGVLRLNAVTECSDDAGTDCLSASAIGYQNGQAGIGSSATSIAANASLPFTNFDLNGDGFKDLVYQLSGYWYVKFGSTSGYGTAVATYVQGNPGSTFLLGDVRGNGQDGILVLQGGYWKYYFWNPASSSFDVTSTSYGNDGGDRAALADVNGDGLPDLVSMISSTSSLNYRINNSSASTVNFLSLTAGPSLGDTADGFYYTAGYLDGRELDFNGDGRADFALHQLITFTWTGPYNEDETGYTARTYLIVSAPGGGYTTDLLTDDTTYTGYPPTYGPRFLDLNDDPCTDYALVTPTLSTAFVSGCGGAGASFAWPVGYVAILDWNGDGRSDVLALNGSGTIDVYISNGTGLNAPIASGLSYQPGIWKSADVNGDGLDDLVLATNSPSSLSYFLHNGSGQMPDLATSFADGYGVTQTVTYQAATWNYYTKQSGSTYPNRDYGGSLQLVGNVNRTDGIGTTYNQTYWYYGGAVNVQGRGFAGFASRKMTDSRTDDSGKYLYTIDYFRRDFPYTGWQTKTETYQSTGTLISQRNLTLTENLLDSTTYNQRHFVYSSGGSSYTYELGGAANGNLITQTSDSRTYDIWGNVTASSKVTTDQDLDSVDFGHIFPEYHLLVPWVAHLSNRVQFHHRHEPTLGRSPCLAYQGSVTQLSQLSDRCGGYAALRWQSARGDLVRLRQLRQRQLGLGHRT